MTPREQLGYAAKAMGLVIDQHLELGAVYAYPKDASLNADGEPNGLYLWRPLYDQADSDRMACKLRIELMFEGNYVGCWKDDGDSVRVTHDGTDEDVCRAVREARLAVAVEIGKGMK
jgi:hypothetical protein